MGYTSFTHKNLDSFNSYLIIKFLKFNTGQIKKIIKIFIEK